MSFGCNRFLESSKLAWVPISAIEIECWDLKYGALGWRFIDHFANTITKLGLAPRVPQTYYLKP